MRKIYFLRLGALIFIVVMSVSLLRELKIYKVIEAQRKTKAIIIEMPDCCNCRQMYAKFKVDSFVFSSRVVFNFCELYKIGDAQEFYHLEKYPDVFVSELYKENSSTNELISSCLLLLFFTFAFAYSFK
jgi:hypothetical protein